MKTIRSKDNPIYKCAAKLTKKKHRDREGKYLLEGIKPVTDALLSGIDVDAIFFRNDLPTAVQKTLGYAAVSKKNPNFIKLDNKLFDNISETENSQGVIAVAAKATREIGDGNVIILDRLQDPGNIGTIIRTAEATGFIAAIATKGTGDVYSPKATRAAAGALFRMPIWEGITNDEIIEFCKSRELNLIATALDDAVNCYETNLTKAAIVIGNEGNGVSEELIKAADLKVKIPMRGEIESLNAAIAAGVLMYESMRQQAIAGR